MAAQSIKRGEIIWLPCEVKKGMFPTEAYICLNVTDDHKVIRGFVPIEDVRNNTQVRAIIARELSEKVALLFRGDIMSQTNPVLVSKDWLCRQLELAG